MNHSNSRKINETQMLEPDLETVSDEDFKDDEIMWAALYTSTHSHSQHSMQTKGGSLATQVALNQMPMS